MPASSEAEGSMTSGDASKGKGKGKESLFVSVDEPSSDENNKRNNNNNNYAFNSKRDLDYNCNHKNSPSSSFLPSARSATRNASSKYDFVKVAPFLKKIFSFFINLPLINSGIFLNLRLKFG